MLFGGNQCWDLDQRVERMEVEVASVPPRKQRTNSARMLSPQS